MKNLFLLLGIVGLFCSCASEQHRKSNNNNNGVNARVTFYSRFEDKFGSRIAIGGRAQECTTIAADPRIFPYGLHVAMYNLKGVPCNNNFQVQDCGRLVKGLHFDVYVYAKSRKESRARLKELTRLNSDYQKVSILDTHFNLNLAVAAAIKLPLPKPVKKHKHRKA